MERKAKCPICGEKFTTTSSKQIYCTRKCYRRMYRQNNAPIIKPKESKVFDCPYTDGVWCDNMECHKCGWNPKVSKRRLEQFMEAHHG